MKTDRFRLTAVVMLCAALALAAAHPASAFVRIARQASPTSPVVQAHWLPEELPLPSVINPINKDKPSSTVLPIVIASAKSWENIPTSYFTVNPYEYGTVPGDSLPSLTFDGQNSCFFDTTGVNFPTAGVIAFVRSIIDGTNGHTLDADLVFNDRDFWSSTSASIEPAPTGQSSVDLQAVLTHEYGHYFSLDHTSVTGATMIPFIQNNTSQRTLELDDTAGNSTVYPEPSFLSDYGTISGTVTSGFTGLAVFGAHVEAWNIANLTPAASISAISGELTLRNGVGEYQIHGLPPGQYAVRIVPLDGVHTTAADANIGGPYNGIDINFETEWWNGANESGDGFSDNPNDAAIVNVGAGTDTPGIDFQTNTYAGRVEIAQYGQFENVVTFRNTGYLAVRFDPPFDAAYTINQVEFPAFTFNGTAPTFPSAKLCVLDPATGLPDLANPLYSTAPLVAAVGVNTIPLNLPGQIGQTYFWVLQFPAVPAGNFPFNAASLNYPFLRQDLTSLERGLFAQSYTIPLAGPGAGVIGTANLTVSMRCQLADPNEVPIKAASNLGGNRRSLDMEFVYVKPGDAREDRFAMPAHSLDHIDLIARPLVAPGTYTVVASGGAGAASIKLTPPPSTTVPMIYSTQAVDKNGNRSLQSSVVIPAVNEDAKEPNGEKGIATILASPTDSMNVSYQPAGDQDYYAISAKPGETITAAATHVGALDGRNDPDYVMFLLDQTGEIVAFNDDTNGLNPKITYVVPPPAGNASGKAPRKFTFLVTDFYGSLLNANGAPRVPSPSNYKMVTSVTPAVNAAMAMRGSDPDQFIFANNGPNPANPISKLLYVIPRSAGSQDVRLRIYDVNGRLVRTLVSGVQSPGPYTAVWDGRDDGGRGVASGNYFARLNVGREHQADSRITILK